MSSYSIMPMPLSDEDRARCEHQALRRRMLAGDWTPDVIHELLGFYSPETLQRITSPDTSRCAARSVALQLNVTLDETPTVMVEGSPDLDAIVTPRLWPIRQYGNFVTLGCNESLVRVDWSQDRYDETGRGIDYRVVWPDCVAGLVAHEYMPDVPVRVEECRQREISPGAGLEWVWEIWDVSNPEKPIFRIEKPDKNGDRIDVTAKYFDFGRLAGRAAELRYPYVDSAGRPILPYILYHREITHRLWNTLHGSELVDGSLKAAVLFTAWLHGFRDCASPQRWGLDVEFPSTTSVATTAPAVDRITLDQGAILIGRSKNGPGTGSVGTLEATMDPEKALAAIMSYLRGLLQDAGLGAADTSDEGLNRVSGYALVVSREGLRKSQRRQIPACRMGDQLLLATAARMVNAYEGGTLPEKPEAYTLTYHGVPKALEEIRTDVEKIQALRGIQPTPLISEVDAMRLLHPELTEEQAQAKLDAIREEMAAHARPAPPVAAPASPMTDPTTGASVTAGRAAADPPSPPSAP